MPDTWAAAYADPPYLGCGRLYVDDHPDALKWDDPEAHRELIEHTLAPFDAWAMSVSSPSLHTILPMCPPDVRVMAWVKPFASFKPNVNPAYAWEPVIVYGGRKRDRTEMTVRDWVSCPITLQRGLTGAKPKRFAFWLFDVLGLKHEDHFVDLFPGTNAVGHAWDEWRRQTTLHLKSAE